MRLSRVRVESALTFQWKSDGRFFAPVPNPPLKAVAMNMLAKES